MAGGLFYNLGRKMGPKVRKARWVWASMAGTEADVIRLEYSVGADLAEEARKQVPIDSDVRSQEALDEVGPRLVAKVVDKQRRFHFDPFQAPEPNAFALPGGFIFISRSIVELCQWSPDEVAFILAHEMGHVLKGHAIERIVTNSAISMASRVGPARGVLGGWLGRVGVRFLETAYSRDQELEADKLGLRLTAAAGYDARAAIRLFGRLAELKKSVDRLDLGQYFSTHPSLDLRIQHAEQFLAKA